MVWVGLFALLSRLHGIAEWVRLWRWQGWTADDGGAVMTEYVVIVGTVSIGLAISIFGLGPAIVDSYARARGIVLMPYP